MKECLIIRVHKTKYQDNSSSTTCFNLSFIAGKDIPLPPQIETEAVLVGFLNDAFETGDHLRCRIGDKGYSAEVLTTAVDPRKDI
jgi:hypothetical protein